MKIEDAVRRLIERLSPEPVCDECVAERLGSDAHQDVAAATAELAGAKGFERAMSACTLCEETKKATRKGHG
jgi:hypothetical protein